MTALTRETILTTLKTITNPESGQDIVTTGLVSSIVIKDGNIGFALELHPEKSGYAETIRKTCEAKILALPGAKKVTVALTAPVTPTQPTKQIASLPGVKKIILIASGKGGVGKSTVTVNLAFSLAQKGLRIGIVDADIYGPSIPHMLGKKDKPDVRNNKLIPLKNYNIEFISIGNLLNQDTAAVWRGPMASKALMQLFTGTEWKDIDILLTDLPPGTGDIQLSIAKNLPVTGAILVSTPQQVALQDVIKGADMFNKTGIPVLGIIENMAWLESNNHKQYPFGHGKTEEYAHAQKLPFLGNIPIDPELSSAADAGIPHQNQYFTTIVEKLISFLTSGPQNDPI